MSNGATTGVPANSFQLANCGNIHKRFIYTDVGTYLLNYVLSSQNCHHEWGTCDKMGGYCMVPPLCSPLEIKYLVNKGTVVTVALKSGEMRV
jgi:hypothetical protein